MQLLIPFAAPPADLGPQALQGLTLPRLAVLTARLGPAEIDDGDELSFSAPHERALARALGWPLADGRLPWAAREARADGLYTGDLAWGRVTPTHWHLGTEQVSLFDPETLELAETEAQALFDAVRPLFTEIGWRVEYAAPTRWYAAHESLEGLRTASLDRVIGRNVDRWLGSDPAARSVRRLQAEVQMLLHTHPLNAAREQRGLRSVNSFWLSGCGRAQPEATPAPPVDVRLRGPALAGDWEGWRRAWQELDAGPLAALEAAVRRGEPVVLALCGERSCASWSGQQAAGGWRSVRQRWRGVLRRPADDVAQLLASL